MEFLRRLFGVQAENNTVNDKGPGSPAPEIAAPGAAINAATPAPMVQTPARASRQEVSEADTLDATPAFGATRQLPPIEPATKSGKHAIYGMSSDIGMVRTNNQDSLFALFCTSMSVETQPDFGLFVVADGMGGHHDGERASAIAVRTIAKYVVENFVQNLFVGPDADRPIISEVLSEAVQKANEAVSGEIPEGGTTVTAAALIGDLVYIAHVGDSRAYLITSDGIEQITRDHSLVQRLIELDQLTPEEAAAHPQRNVLYRAIGQSENLEVDAITHRLPAGARLILCCDGLWNMVSPSNIQQIVQAARSPQEACDQLIAVANERGGPDNITVILIQMPG
jgi:protein phosphatase